MQSQPARSYKKNTKKKLLLFARTDQQDERHCHSCYSPVELDLNYFFYEFSNAFLRVIELVCCAVDDYDNDYSDFTIILDVFLSTSHMVMVGLSIVTSQTVMPT